MVLTDDVFQVSLQELSGYLALRPRLIKQILSIFCRQRKAFDQVGETHDPHGGQRPFRCAVASP